ncbi:MAG: uroporphyrinogen decarboxylase family protein [Calditrichia bacterium]
MNSRERIKTIIAGEKPDRCGFWLGNPHPDSWPVLHRYFRTGTEEELRRKLQDDFRWITPQYLDTTYRHPQGLGIFDLWKSKQAHGQAGPLAVCREISELDDMEWPNPGYLDFSETIGLLDAAGEHYRASGFWAPFFHDVMDLFGMENFLLRMFEQPEFVHAVFKRVCGFYLEANRRFFAQAGNRVDGYFYGNDFGTQMDLLITPQQFDEFILPWIIRFNNLAHDSGYQVIVHSCGSVYRLLDRFIESGVDCLHPLQAGARGMDAASLANSVKGKIAFLGGIDTQQILVQASPAGVKKEVQRIREILGPQLIISPSHEALLPDVPPENVQAMAEAAR